ncbi:DUF6766 family protein [Actinopolymorpha pittospori]|uniref:Uncharacterized protein n=1 Tax=Actinopolymorpha pittospori TaxID=648752 RepID=A0A927MQ79_9ACTN|nr:DUF6766 family protein [Actinopolymorpha pittospori]MBE1604674.1 hypothetical protein [Actinopolymorpha pittospori]
MRHFFRNYSLTLVFGVAFLGVLVAQALVGHADFNERQLAEGFQQISLWSYLTSSDFGVDVMENWQSEYLQFFLYIMGTVWLVQRGSPESKPPDEVGQQTDKEQQVGPYARLNSPSWARSRGLRLGIYSHSLGLVMALIFLASWFTQSVTGVVSYNEQQLGQLQAPISWSQYILAPDFWNRTLQNWQSELLALVSMAILAVFLRERGSPESKPVGTPNDDATGRTG